MISIAIATPEASAYRVQTIEGQIVVGRDAACDLVLTARGVSGTHCRLSPMQGLPGAFMLEDLGSKYGTFVNRERVGRPVVVSSRDVITVGGHELLLAEPGHEHAALERLRGLGQRDSQPAPVPAQSSAAVGVLAAYDLTAPWLQQFEYFDAIARAWHDKGRPSADLLRGGAIAVAEQWLAAGARQSPAPAALHRDFIERSRSRRSSRGQAVALVAVFAVVAVVGVATWHFKGEEIRQAFAPPPPVVTLDPTTPIEGDPEAVGVDVANLVEESRALADVNTRLLVQAALLDVATKQNPAATDDQTWSLEKSVHADLAKFRETILRGHSEAVTKVRFGPRGMLVASASDDGSARLWDLSSATGSSSTTLRGHTGPVTALGFAPDGHWLATGGEDGRVWRWDLLVEDPGGTGAVFNKHESAVRHIAWEPSGRFVVSGDDDGTLVVWDMTAPKDEAAVWARPAHDGPITALLFDGGEDPSLYTGSDDRTARRWKLREDGSLSRQQTFEEHTGGVIALAASADSRWVATATTSGELFLFERYPATKKQSARTEVVPLLGHRDSVTQLAFAPDGHWLISAGDDGTLHAWDLTVDDPSVSSVVLSGHTGDVTALDVAVGGKRAVSAGRDNSIRVWDLDKVQRVIDQVELTGHEAPVASIAVSPDGLWLASGSEDKTVRVWDALGRSAGRGGRLLRVGASPVLDIDLSASDRLITVAEGKAALWDLSRPERRPEALALPGANGILNAAAFDPRGQLVAGAGEAGTISVWTLGGAGTGTAPRVLEGHTGSVNAMAFTPDGQTLLSVSSDRSVRAWPIADPGAEDGAGDGAGETTAKVWTVHQDEVHVLAVSPRGDYAFSGGLRGTIVRWSLADGTASEFAGHEGEILQLRFSVDGRKLASASADRQVRVWDVASGQMLYKLRGHDEPVNAVAFSRNGLLATAGQDRTIRVWDLSSAHPDEGSKALVGHEQSVTDLVFIGDGGMLASSSNDATVRLWRLDTRESIALSGHDGVVSQLGLTAKESLLVSASFDGSVRVWPLGGPGLARQICQVVGRGLSKEESLGFFGRVVADPCGS